MSDFATEKANEFYRNATQQHQRALYYTAGTLLLLLLGSLLVAWRISLSITPRLSRVLAGVEVLKSGDLGHRVRLSGDDEIGALAVAIDEMADELQRSTASIDELNREIEERHRAENRAQELGSIFDESLNEIYVLDEQSFEFLLVNLGARHNLGYSTDELDGLTLFNVESSMAKPELLDRLRPLLGREDKRVSLTLEFLRKDGTRYPVDAAMQLVRFGGRDAIMTVVFDMTERNRMNEERLALQAKIQHTQKLESLGVLAGGIAHDFNNILMAILGNAAVLCDELPAESSSRTSAHEIESAARRAAELCNQMLAYSGKGRFVVKEFCLNDLVLEIGEMLKVSISKNATLEYDLATDLPFVSADSSQIGQVLLNLITNASDAIDQANGSIVVRTGRQLCSATYLRRIGAVDDLPGGEYVFLEVTDDGCGMSDEAMARIFEPFFTTKFTGRGLGMAAVQGIVQGHDGVITIASEIGLGTTVTMLLPALEQANPLVVAESRSDAHLGGGLVLVADDDGAVQRATRRMLKQLGFDVLIAADGLEALEIFREHVEDIGLVIIDLTMPRMGGEEAIRRIRELRHDVPTILSSGYNEQEVTQHFDGKGLDGFLQKPYVPAQLRIQLEKILGSRERAMSSA